jgi:hypothetical protein
MYDMSQVDTVALWAGLISIQASQESFLSIVAMVFAIRVNNRATDINNQMIRSLQKIESSVERVSADTRELITAGWHKMLGDMDRVNEPDPVNSEASDKISSGIASEVRSELTEDINGNATVPQIDRIERALRDLQETVAAQLRQKPISGRTDSVDSLVQTLNSLPVEAKALLSILSRGGHLDRGQYRAAIQNTALKHSIQALRSNGLLVPLEGFSEGNEKVPVYYLPPGLGKRARLAVQLAGEVPREVLDSIAAALRKIGYASVSSREL